MSTSDDLVTSYLQAFDELRARKRWSTQSVTLRFVALGLVDVEIQQAMIIAVIATATVTTTATA